MIKNDGDKHSITKTKEFAHEPIDRSMKDEYNKVRKRTVRTRTEEIEW